MTGEWNDASEETLFRAALEYFRDAAAGRPTYQVDSHHEVWQELQERAQRDDPEMAWRLVKRLVNEAPEQALEYIAAGPLEDLIAFHGEAFVDRIVDAAAAVPRLREALSFVIIDDWVPDAVASRLRPFLPEK